MDVSKRNGVDCVRRIWVNFGIVSLGGSRTRC